MAVTASVQLGVPTTIAQTTAVALPTRLCSITATTAIQFSADGTIWTADIAASTTGTSCAGAAFVRCTTGSSIITLRA
jgi:hypothetical protein